MARLKNNNIFSPILKDKDYRGQIYRVRSYSSKPKIYISTDSIGDKNIGTILNTITMELDYEGLFMHQGECVKQIISGIDVMLMVERGSGRLLTQFLTTIMTNIVKGGSCLIILPDKAAVKDIIKMFREKLSRIGWFCLFESADNQGDLIKVIDDPVDVLITDFNSFEELLMNKFEVLAESLFFNNLSLVICPDATSLATLNLSRLRWMILRITHDDNQKINFLIDCDPIDSPDKFLSDIAGRRKITTVSEDGSPKNYFTLYFWTPPFIIKEEIQKVVVERKDYISEVVNCIARIIVETEINKILIWHAFAPIPDDQLRKIRESIIDSLAEMGATEAKKYNLQIINNPGEIIRYHHGYFDVVFLLGLPRDFGRIRNILGNYLREHGLGIVITPEEPLSHFLLRDEQFWQECSGRGEILIPKNVAENPDERAARYMSLKFGGKHYSFVRNDDIPFELFPNAILYREQKQLVVESVNFEHGVVGTSIAPESTPVLRFPKIEFRIDKEEIIGEKRINSWLFRCVKLEHSIKFSGYAQYQNYALRDRSDEEIQGFPELSRICYGIKIESEEPHGMVHMFRVFLPVFFKNIFSFLWLFHKDNALYLISFSDDYKGIIEQLFNRLEVFNTLFEYAYNNLLSCPCVNGCPHCLMILSCAEDNHFSKSKLLEIVARAIGKSEELASILKFKKDGLSGEFAQRAYEKCADRVFKIFEEKLDLYIKNKAEIKAVERTSEFAGLFEGDTVKVVYDLPERDAVEVIAHEYAHNWETEEGNMAPELRDHERVPCKGTLVSEGFAEWVAFKVLDFYGLIRNMESIHLREYDKYGEGFHLMNWIEENVAGFYGVIEFVKSGRVVDPATGEEFDLEQLLKKSGIGNKLKKR